jgi:hypothetical protein
MGHRCLVENHLADRCLVDTAMVLTLCRQDKYLTQCLVDQTPVGQIVFDQKTWIDVAECVPCTYCCIVTIRPNLELKI